MTNAQTVYEKMVKGDPISDEELDYGAQFFEELSAKLRQVGPIFKLAANEANRAYLTLHSYKVARKQS